MAISVILQGDTAREIKLSPAPGYDYGGCTLEVEFNGARRTFDGLAAGEGVTLELTADETARMQLGTGRVYMRLRNAAGEVISLPWAKVKVTDAPGEVRAAQITIDPATLDVEDATAGDSLGAVKSKLNAVLAFLRGAAGCALLASMPCMGAEVAPLYTTLNDMPGDAPLMTNAAEYVDAVVDAKADKASVYTKAESDTRITAVSNRTEEAYSAAESLADGVNSLAGTIGTHISDTKNPHKVTAEQVGALPIIGGTLTGDLAVGKEHTASQMLTVASESDANGITLQGGKSNGNGSRVFVGGSNGSGGSIIIEGGGTIGGRLYVRDITGAGGGAIEVSGMGASIKKDGKEVATEEQVAEKADKASVYTKAESDTRITAVSNRTEEAYSAAESLADGVNSLAGTIGTHISDTKNPHKVTAEQVGALPIIGGTLTGDLAVGKEHTASQMLTVASESDANGITLQGGKSNGNGSRVFVGGSNGSGGSIIIEGGGTIGGRLYVRDITGAGGGAIEVSGMGASIKKDGKEVATEEQVAEKADKATTLAGYGITNAATEAYVDDKVRKAVLPTDPTFSNAVLAVGLNIDTNSVAVLNEIAETFDGFPIEGTATTVGGLLAALAAAVAWLKKNKVGSFASVGGSSATVENGVAKLDDFFTNSNSLLTATIDARLPYLLNPVTDETGLLKDRAINTTSLASVTVPDNFTDLLVRASVASSISVTMPESITTKYGDTFPGEAGEYLITITKTGATEAYVRTIKLEVANA